MVPSGWCRREPGRTAPRLRRPRHPVHGRQRLLRRSRGSLSGEGNSLARPVFSRADMPEVRLALSSSGVPGFDSTVITSVKNLVQVGRWTRCCSRIVKPASSNRVCISGCCRCVMKPPYSRWIMSSPAVSADTRRRTAGRLGSTAASSAAPVPAADTRRCCTPTPCINANAVHVVSEH
jgi:hypothetical protein